MNEEFAVLKDMIPACAGVEMHKLAILQAGIEYVRWLEECVARLKRGSGIGGEFRGRSEEGEKEEEEGEGQGEEQEGEQEDGDGDNGEEMEVEEEEEEEEPVGSSGSSVVSRTSVNGEWRPAPACISVRYETSHSPPEATSPNYHPQSQPQPHHHHPHTHHHQHQQQQHHSSFTQPARYPHQQQRPPLPTPSASYSFAFPPIQLPPCHHQNSAPGSAPISPLTTPPRQHSYQREAFVPTGSIPAQMLPSPLLPPSRDTDRERERERQQGREWAQEREGEKEEATRALMMLAGEGGSSGGGEKGREQGKRGRGMSVLEMCL